MRIILKEPVYFVIDIEDTCNRQLLISAAQETLLNHFEDLVQTIVLDPEDTAKIEEIAGSRVSVFLTCDRHLIVKTPESEKKESYNG